MTHYDEYEDIPLADNIDNIILMHRDAHFGGSFDIMLDYYRKEGKGISPDIEYEKIVELAETEKQTQQNLAPILLTGQEAEHIARAKDSYKKLKDVYAVKNPKNNHARLIADLILAEEFEPEKEIAAIVKEKDSIVPALIELLKTEDYYNPLFPGYGHAPALAAHCLGKIGDKRAIIALFEAIGESDFFDEDIILQALHEIGAPAKEFLLHVLHSRPINMDNDRAAIALVTFKDDPEVAEKCFEMLQDPEILKHLPIATYLVLACEGLKEPTLRQRFMTYIDHPSTPKMLQQDLKIIAKSWKDT